MIGHSEAPILLALNLSIVGVACLALAGPALGNDECLLKCPTRKGAFGRPEPDKACVLKCLQIDEGTAPGDAGGQLPVSPLPRFTQSWHGNEEFRQQQRSLQSLINAIPDPAFRTWVTRNVVFDRVSQGPNTWKAGVRPGLLIVYDSFWTLNRAAQESVLTFELAKALWFDRINPGPREARSQREIEFEALLRRHQKTIEAMRFAAWRGEDLGHLTDQDLQSWFAYSCRAAMFGLSPPLRAPTWYSAADWKTIQQDWRQAQGEVRQYVTSILSHAPAPKPH